MNTTNTVSFVNPGEIDIRLVNLLGVSVKEGDAPIGYFGTGLKYAIAVCLRNKLKVDIWSGLRLYSFSLKEESIRGKTFSQVYMNDEPLSITDNFGRNWSVQEAFRELSCNAIDEGGNYFNYVVEPAVGSTVIHVQGEAMVEAYARRFETFLCAQSRGLKLIAKTADVEIYKAPALDLVRAFYRGVQVWKSLFHASRYLYNITGKLRLTEDRTAAISYELHAMIGEALVTLRDPVALRSVLGGVKGSFETATNFEYNKVKEAASAEFLTELTTMVKQLGRNSVNASFLRLFADELRDALRPKKATTDALEDKTLQKAINFCAAIHLPITSSITIVDHLEGDAYGQALNGEILISRHAFTHGTKFVASTLIEEEAHCIKGYSDCTRELQEYLLNNLVHLGEKYLGEPL